MVWMECQAMSVAQNLALESQVVGQKQAFRSRATLRRERERERWDAQVDVRATSFAVCPQAALESHRNVEN